MGKCVKCGRETKLRYTYYTARIADKTSYVSEGMFSKKTTKETTYTNIRPQIGYICSGEGCWKNAKMNAADMIRDIVISIVVLFLAALSIYFFISILTTPLQNKTFINKLFTGALPSLIFLVPAIIWFRAILRVKSKYSEPPANDEVGARIVCEIMGRKGPNGTVLLTPGEVKRLSSIR